MREVTVNAVLAGELASGQQVTLQQSIGKTKTLLRAFAHGNGHGAVQFDNRGWLSPEQPAVKQRNLPPRT